MNVYYLPGITASFLSFDRFGLKPYYFDVGALVSNDPRTAALDRDGLSPYPDGGQQLFPYAAYQYPELKAILQPQIPGFSLVALPYDWRKEITVTAASIADQIERECSPQNPATLLCHSMGGLVGVNVHKTLVARSKADYIRRVITLGSPHAGSYAVVAVMNALLPGGDKGTLVNFFETQFSLLVAAAGSFARALIATWPGFAELYPSLQKSAAYGDPQRKLIYNPALYPDLQPSGLADRLTENALFWQPFQVSAVQDIEQRGKLFTVSGTSAFTIRAIKSDASDFSTDNFVRTIDGDGLVTVRSSQSGDGIIKPYTHSELPLKLASDGTLAMLINMPEPVVPPPVVPNPFTPPPEVLVLIPVTSVALLNVLLPLQPETNKFTVLAFPGGDRASPVIVGQERSQRSAWKRANNNGTGIAAVYQYNGTSWFYVPTSPPQDPIT